MRLKIAGRLNLLTVAALCAMTIGLGMALFRLSAVLFDQIESQTHGTTDSAYSVVEYYHSQEEKGAMTRDQAQAAAMNAVRAMRYGESGYFWINDKSRRMLMHPVKPELVGKDMSSQVDADGVHPFVEFVKTATADPKGGVVRYRWPKPGKEDPQPKVSYVRLFAPWGWIVGTGLYEDDVWSGVWQQSMILIGLALMGMVGMAGLGWLLARSVTMPLNALTRRMRSLADGDATSNVPGLDRIDELGDMAKALGVFCDSALAKEKAEAAKAEADRAQKIVVEALTGGLEAMSQGDLTLEIREAFPAGYEALRANYNEALQHLRELIGAMTEASDGIRTGSDEIARAADDLARRTETNAASLEEASASLSQMEERLKSTAAAAERTVGQTVEAVANVEGGRATADKVVAAMNRVAESAQGIDGVIEGLDKIAFQTRVLAMNAAVEAGRAGEAGRGFAVVADLVSQLAMRSEEEAKRAREQLTATQDDIGEAVSAVHNVDGALASISSSVEQVHTLIASMAEDNRVQSTTISGIASVVNEMDRSTQQNAAMVEQTSAAARTLAHEVETLASRAHRFKVSSDNRPGPRSFVPQRPAASPLPAPGGEGSAASVKPVPVSAVADGDWAEF